jgi:asparagine N-glycosylation enzyme membrane subunit Stt3
MHPNTDLQASSNASTSRRASTFIIWAIVGCIAALSCYLNPSNVRIGEEMVPMGNDSFYHARRILDAVADPAAFYEFDPKIHAPEGSLLVWPWGYDYFMAHVVRLAVDLGLSSQPLHALLWAPLFAVFLSIGFLVLIARRLGLSSWTTTLAALCMALAPSTKLLHGLGEIDHHFAEQIFILAALWAGLAWFQSRNVSSAIALGAIFGVSLSIHNGLFILQLPFLVTLFARWLQGDSAPQRSTYAFAIALLGSAIAVLIPSDPFRLGRFEFYTLSWFHFYIVCITAAFTLLLPRLKPSRTTIIAVVGVSLLLVAPLLNEIRIAQSFLQGSMGILSQIDEVQSPLSRFLAGETLWVTFFYSLLIWIAPLTLVVCVVQCWRERQSPRLLFWVVSAFGLALLAMQIRMHYFGAFALYLPWLVLAQDFASKREELAKRTYLLATLALLLAYVPQIRHTVIAPYPRGGDPWFDHFHGIVPALRKACQEDPGAVLADTTSGHYIRYYSDCSVVANNFLLTEQQFRKADEVTQLLSLSAAELSVRAPYVKYVLLRASSITKKADGTYEFAFFSESSQLSRDLFFRPQAPAGYELVGEVVIGVGEAKLPYARLYRIKRTEASLNDIAE